MARYVAHTVFVDQMLSELPDELFREWCAYDIIEPIGQEGTHRLLSVIGSATTWGKCSPAEIAPWLPKPEDNQDRVATAAEVYAMAQAAMNGGA